MVQQTEPVLTGGRRLVARLAVGSLAVAQAVVGAWALLAPRSFYTSFPASGHAWVALLPPFNEHLVRDVGALSLALAVLLGTAVVVPSRLLVRTAVAAFAVYAVPHTLFHGLHLEGFSAVDAVMQMTGFAAQLAACVVALWATTPRGQRQGRTTPPPHA